MKKATLKALNEIANNEKNQTRKNNINKLIALATKVLNDNDIVNLNNIGTIGEKIVYNVIATLKTTKTIQAHNNESDTYDLIVNGKKCEIKTTLKGDSNELTKPMTTYVLATGGLYKLPAKYTKQLVNTRLTSNQPKQYLLISWANLLK